MLIRVRPAAAGAALALGLAAWAVLGPLRAAVRERWVAPATAGTQRVRVALAEYRIVPELVRVPAGSRVELLVENRGRRAHGLEVEGLGVGVARLAPGQSVTLVLPAGRPGAYRLRCGEPGHGELGMAAWLVVERR